MAHIVVAIPAVEDSDLPETLMHLYALSSRQHELTVLVHEQCSQHGQLSVDKLPYFDEDDTALLGAYTLEGMFLAVDPYGQRLVPIPGLLK